jgi:hypothetical protein
MTQQFLAAQAHNVDNKTDDSVSSLNKLQGHLAPPAFAPRPIAVVRANDLLATLRDNWFGRMFSFESGFDYSSKFKHWFLIAIVAAVSLWSMCNTPCFAQAVSWAEVDIGSPATAGSFVYTAGSPPLYTTAGAGSGFNSFGFDTLGFTEVATNGNIEMNAELVSESSATAGAFGGIAMRDSNDVNAGFGAIGVTVGTGVTFSSRTRGGGAMITVNGPTVTLPLYLRLVRSGDTISGYYSSDGETYTLLSSRTQANIMPPLFYDGFISFSTTSALNTSVFQNVTYATSVPQPAANLLLWLRSDLGVVSAAGAVSQWNDQSGNGLNAVQATGTAKPTLTTGAINNAVLPALTFNGTSQNLSMPAGFANLTAGASIFIVLKPTSATATGDPCAFGNAANSNAIFAQTIGQEASLSCWNVATSSSVTTTGNPLSNSQYQLLEETLLPGATAGTATGTIFVNGVQKVQSTTLQNLVNISRTQNFIGAGIGAANFFQGGIAEVLFYSSPLSSSQRASLESYVLSKYGLGNQPTLDPPMFTPASAVLTPNGSVSLSQDQGATVWFTTDGATPSPGIPSQWFNGLPLQIFNYPETVKAIAVAPFFTNSSVATAVYQDDPNSLPVSRNGLVLWLRGDNVATSGSNVTTWSDVSGSGNNATQATSAKQPILVSNSINGMPSVSFNGTTDFLQLPAGMANLSSGASIFAIIDPTGVTAGARILDFGNGATSDNLQLQEPASASAELQTYNGATPTSVTSSSAITLNQFQLLEAIDNGTGTATIYTNSVQGAQSTTMNALNNLTRSSNFIGQGSAGGNFFKGKIAELLVFNRGITATEQAALEGYLIGKFQLLSANTTPAPVFSVAAGTLTIPTQVAIEAPAAATIFVTVDGSTPTTASPPYTKPLAINFTQTVKAIAVINGVSSSVTSAAYTLNATHWPAPATATTPLQINTQLPGVSIPQDSNQH